MLPAILLLCAWWRRAHVTMQDVKRVTPYFALSLILGLVTVWYQTFSNLGAALQGMGRSEEAVAHLEEALRLDPSSATARTNLGGVLYGLGRLQESAAQFEEALRLKPESFQARNNLASVLHGLGRIEEATEHYRAVLGERPDLAGTDYNLALALQELGRFREAAVEYSVALQSMPDDARALNDFARLLAACPDASVRMGSGPLSWPSEPRS